MTGRFTVDEEPTGYVPFIQGDTCVPAERHKVGRKGCCHLKSKLFVGSRFPESLEGNEDTQRSDG
jgi:hypothetical protein